MNWHVVEEHSFEIAAAQLGGLQKVDRALAPIMSGIYGNPLGYAVVPGSNGIRLARTRLVIDKLELIQALRVWFRVNEATQTVYLLYAEIAPPEDMEIGDSIW